MLRETLYTMLFNCLFGSDSGELYTQKMKQIRKQSNDSIYSMLFCIYFRTAGGQLGAKMLSQLRNHCKKLVALLMDEISMVPNEVFYMINGRLNQIVGIVDQETIFGGLLLIIFGDMYQLPPVLASRIYSDVKEKIVGAGGTAIHLWRDTVEMCELTIIERQKGDTPYAELLGRARDATHTRADVETLKGRTFSALGKDENDPEFDNVPFLYYTNQQVNARNSMKLMKLKAIKENEAREQGKNPGTASKVLLAVDTFADAKDRQTKMMKQLEKLIPKAEDVDLTGGLKKKIEIVKGARVVLRRNIAVADKLINGSMGTIYGWTKAERMGLPEYIYIKFDSVKGQLIGQKTREKCKHKLPPSVDKSVVPIEPIEVEFLGTNGRTPIKRLQFPVMISFALTIHRSQGATYEKVVVSLTGVNKCGLAYVALSRVTSLDGLFLSQFDPASLKADRHVSIEMNRLRQVSNIAQQPLPRSPKTPLKMDDRAEPWNERKKKQKLKGKFQQFVDAFSLKKAAKDEAALAALHVAQAAASPFVHMVENNIVQMLIQNFVTAGSEMSTRYYIDNIYGRLENLAWEHIKGCWELIEQLQTIEPRHCSNNLNSRQVQFEILAKLYEPMQDILCPIRTMADGNCLFRAHSISIFGTEEYHVLLRALTHFLFIVLKSYFQYLIQIGSLASPPKTSEEAIQERYQTLLLETYVLHTWAGEYANQSIAIISKRDLYVYGPCYHRTADGNQERFNGI